MKKVFYHDAVFYEEDVPRAILEKVNLEVTNKCPRCKQPWSKGELPEGTAIEVECRRCRLKIYEIVPYSPKSS